MQALRRVKFQMFPDVFFDISYECSQSSSSRAIRILCGFRMCSGLVCLVGLGVMGDGLLGLVGEGDRYLGGFLGP